MKKNGWKYGKPYKVGDIFYTLTFYNGEMHLDKLQVVEIGGYSDLGRQFILHNLRAKADMESGRSREGWLHHSAEDFIGSRIYDNPLDCFKDIQFMIEKRLTQVNELVEEFYTELAKTLKDETTHQALTF